MQTIENDATKVMRYLDENYPVAAGLSLIVPVAGIDRATAHDVLDQLVMDGAVELLRHPIFPWDQHSELVTTYRAAFWNITALMTPDESEDGHEAGDAE